MGKHLLELHSYRFQPLVTRLPAAPHPPPEVRRCYNGRADCENVITELQSGSALAALCLEKCSAAEAALSLTTPTYKQKTV